MFIEYDLATLRITRADSGLVLSADELAAYTAARPGRGAFMAEPVDDLRDYAVALDPPRLVRREGPSAADLEREAAAQRHADAESDAVLRQLVNATPAQIESWLAANVTSIATARRVLLALALAVRHLHRR